MTTTAAFLLFFAWLAQLGLRHVEREPNDRLADATPLVQTHGGLPGFLVSRSADGIVERGRLEPGDVDCYSFAAQAGDVLMVSLVESGRGAFADPVLGVTGPGEARPRLADDDGGPGFLPRFSMPIDRTGVWRIVVAGFGDDELDGGDHEEEFAYDLVVAVASQPVVIAEHDVRGANDMSERAEALPVLAERAVVVTGTLEPGDTDSFLVPLLPRTLLAASLYDDEGGAFDDSRLSVLDLDGRVLAEDDDSGPGFLSNLALAPARAGGPVVVRVSGFDPFPDDAQGHEERFRYRLVVSARRAGPGS